MLAKMEYSFAVVPTDYLGSLKEVEKYYISLIGKASLANTRGGVSNIHKIESLGDREVVDLLLRCELKAK